MHRVRRPIAYLLLCWYLPACASAQYRGTVPIEPTTDVAGLKSAFVAVAAGTDTLVWQVSNPRVRNDSLVGRAAACKEGCGSPSLHWPVALSEVVEVRGAPSSGAAGKALLIGLGVTLVVGLIVVAASVPNYASGFGSVGDWELGGQPLR